MEHAYEKLMKEHNLSYSELPMDARIGIDMIQQIGKSITLAEKQGHSIKPKVFDKLKANDKWVVRDILDYVEGKNPDHGTIPHKADEVIKEIKDDTGAAAANTNTSNSAPANTTPPTPAAVPAAEPKLKEDDVRKIDTELKTLFDAQKTLLSLSEVKSSAPKTYDAIFDAYEVDGQNGIETDYYMLVETSKEQFTLTKK